MQQRQKMRNVYFIELVEILANNLFIQSFNNYVVRAYELYMSYEQTLSRDANLI